MPAKDIFYLALYHVIILFCLAAFWEPWLLIPASLMSMCVTLDTALKMLLHEEDRQENGEQ